MPDPLTKFASQAGNLYSKRMHGSLLAEKLQILCSAISQRDDRILARFVYTRPNAVTLSAML